MFASPAQLPLMHTHSEAVRTGLINWGYGVLCSDEACFRSIVWSIGWVCGNAPLASGPDAPDYLASIYEVVDLLRQMV
jgi:hypothetical protein